MLQWQQQVCLQGRSTTSSISSRVLAEVLCMMPLLLHTHNSSSSSILQRHRPASIPLLMHKLNLQATSLLGQLLLPPLLEQPLLR
jgi:hypothetical protein